MDHQRAAIISKWLLGTRGTMTQEVFLEDLRSVTGWSLKRSSLSKYENAHAVPWQATLDKFERYARERGKPLLDLTPPKPLPSIEERTVEAIERQAAAIDQLVEELRAWRRQDRDRLLDMETTVARLVSGRLSAPGSGEPAAPDAPLGST